MLNMEIENFAAEHFHQMRNKFLDIMILPKYIAEICNTLGFIDIEEVRNFREIV